MPRPKEETIWCDLSDDEYALMQAKSWASKTHASELTQVERADFRDNYPTQFEAAEAMLALQDGALVSALKPAGLAAMKQLCPELLAEYEDAQAKVLAPIIAEPWKHLRWAELKPAQRAAWAKADAQGYAAERAAHLGAH